MLNIKFHRTENPLHHVSNFTSVMTLKGIGKDIFHIIFPPFDKDVMRRYNAVDPQKLINWDDLNKDFLHRYSYNADLPITLKNLKMTQ